MPDASRLRAHLEDLLLRLKVDDGLHRAEMIGRRLLLAAELRDCEGSVTKEHVSEDSALDLEAARLAGREEVENEILNLLLKHGLQDRK